MSDSSIVTEGRAPGAAVDASGGAERVRAANPDTATLLDLYTVMAGIRRFEEVSQALFRRGAIRGSIHLCMGQEAVSAGVCGLLGEGDKVTATYRGHGHALAVGVDPLGLMAEMLHKSTGTCGGRAGSMNVIDRDHGLLGCFGIVGGSIATAVGAALALQRRGDGVAVAFFGDGAVNHAYFYESLNFAAMRKLPVVFVCENNLYGEFTPMASVTPGGILARARAFDIPATSVDGQDVCAVRAAADEAITRAREFKGPSFLEALTYRFNDHARGDPFDYRPEGEMQAWKARDPLTITRKQLRDRHGVSEEDLDQVILQVRTRYETIQRDALAAPLPEPSDDWTEFKPTRN
jgi:TPP-dependent pyruvate/acetoin dehydrogenase alpha subunit